MGTVAGTTQSAAERGKAAQQAQAAATEAKVEAEETQAAAEESAQKADAVGNKIDEVVSAASTATTPTNNGRVKRQSDTTIGIPSFTVPSSCASFQSMVKEFNKQIGLETKTGFKTAAAIGDKLTEVKAADIDCKADDLTALQEVKKAVVAAKEVANTAVINQKIKIKEAIDTINAAIAEITAVNKIFEESGQTPFADPGTTLATVTAPTLPTEATTTTAQAATQDNGAT